MGFLAAVGFVAVAIAYAVAVGFGIARAGLDEPIVDPVLWVMEVLTLVSAPLLVILIAALHAGAAPERRVFGLIALSFATAFAALTSGVHFTTLTAGRNTGFTALEWPSVLYAVELLAWDVFLGLALLFAGAVFAGSESPVRIRWMLWASGGSCVVGTIGPVTGEMALQRIGILGYAVLLPVTCAMLAIHFRAGTSRGER